MTYTEAFKSLRDPYCSKGLWELKNDQSMIKNPDIEIDDIENNEFQSAIVCGFSWCDSKDGDEFWYNVYAGLKDNPKKFIKPKSINK